MKKVIGILAANKKVVAVIVTGLIGLFGITLGQPSLVEPVVSIGLEIAQAFAQ